MNIKKKGDGRNNMDKYLEQAKNFLNKANAKCEIVYGGMKIGKKKKREIGMM